MILLYISADFVVLDMDEDSDVTLILGRPFLATTRTINDVGMGELVLYVGDETITLQARDSVKISSDRDDFTSSVNMSNHVVQPSSQETPRKNAMETCSSHYDSNRMITMNECCKSMN